MIILPFVLATLLGLGLVPAVRQLSHYLGRDVKPRADRWHKRPTATLGGIGIFGALILSLLVSAVVWTGWEQIPWGLLLGSLVIFGFGLYDDFRPLSPPAKLVGQLLAATAVVSLGYTTNFFTPRLANPLLAQLPNIALTYFWLIGIANAVNLLDNMDGLAGGIALITALFLSYFFWQSGNQGLLAISLALAGGVLAFLVFNFPPASIFMGDSGSQLLGFTLAALAIARQPQASNVLAVFGVPTLLFLLPILDTTLVMLTRTLRGESPIKGGRDHASHRLIAFGLSERQAVLVLYAVALLAGIAGLGIEALDYSLSLVVVPIVVLSLALLTAYLGGLKVVIGAKAVRLDGPGQGFSRMMLELAYRRRVFEMILDFFLIGIAYYLGFLVHYGLTLDETGLELYLQSLPLALAAAFIAFFVFGVYRGVWRYIGVDDLVRYARTALGVVFLVTPAVWLLYSRAEYSLIIFLLFGFFLFLGLAATRSSFRILDLFSGQQKRMEEASVLICGARDAGEIALRWILMNPGLHYRVVGFLDRDPLLVGRQIHGVSVIGVPDELGPILQEYAVEGMIVTSDFLEVEESGTTWMETAHRQGVWVRSLRLEFELYE
jgi:UDP-GlcNAc:undecaprenyl-phosphate/decaprenyl-phosphate GlcNAc-1-phosphate transferase